jgi:hypothetical protein
MENISFSELTYDELLNIDGGRNGAEVADGLAVWGGITLALGLATGPIGWAALAGAAAAGAGAGYLIGDGLY